MSRSIVLDLAAAALLGAAAVACGGGAAPPATTAPTGGMPAGAEHPGMATAGGAEAAGTVRIVEPADGATLPAGPVTVRTEVVGAAAGEEVHWHLWLDGELVGMITGLETGLQMEPGEHELVAAISDAEEHEEDPGTIRSRVRITVVP